MSVFMAAIDNLFADPNIARDAIFVADGGRLFSRAPFTGYATKRIATCDSLACWSSQSRQA